MRLCGERYRAVFERQPCCLVGDSVSSIVLIDLGCLEFSSIGYANLFEFLAAEENWSFRLTEFLMLGLP